MSEMLPISTMDAGDWIGVASEMVDYLDGWENGSSDPIPERTYKDAKRFFSQVLKGLSPESYRSASPVPLMAAISSLTVAVDVLTALPNCEVETYEEVKDMVRSFLARLDGFRKAPLQREEKEIAHSMKQFFGELQDQGNIAREEAYFRDAAPDHSLFIRNPFDLEPVEQ